MCAVVATALLKLIALFTNLFYFQRWSFQAVSPASHHLGPWAILPPIVGGLIIGLMARLGSDRIRGHGIPEALEAILIGRARMEPKVAVLKPVSSAISIGSGGPFGAEGPIIMTGGALGSIIAQVFRLSAAERKVLLVAGAAGGMSATFATPIAAVLLAVELLLFEWKPRSFIPVALASGVAAALRPFLLGTGPLFPLSAPATFGLTALAACAVVGVCTGLVSAWLTWAVYAAEDLFQRLPFHWMWWPALGGLAIGIGGLIEPRALGVGYDVIADVLGGRLPAGALSRLLLVKGTIWSLALGSGTSGGVLAPLLMMGASVGSLLSPLLPAGGHALWPLIGLAAVLAGTMRCPLTGIVFALELSQRVDALLPILIACAAAYGLTVLIMPRSILTEKVARRGHHLTREYSIDPLEALLVRQIATSPAVSVPASLPITELAARYFDVRHGRPHQGYPVVDANGRLVGVVTRSELLDLPPPEELDRIPVASLLGRAPVVAYPDETCRAAADRMVTEGVGRLPVVSREAPHQLVGILTRSDLLKARELHLETEHRRESIIKLPGGDLWQPFSRG
ncbi:MAG TPA: chloride channel protein [Candidatus Sulfotelmatobacter sp.]|nr:chloride channel protein [Candidatus Sulfotelmatobacter sp.]